MTEIIFIVEEDPTGGYTARSVQHDIFTQGNTLDELKTMVRDAVACAFDAEADRPKMIRLHHVRDEVIAA